MSYGYTHVPPQPASNHPTEQSLLILLRYITHISTPLSTLNNFRKFHFAFRTTFALHSAFSISISLSIAHTIFASFLINFTLFQTSAENSKLYYYNLAAGENSLELIEVSNFANFLSPNYVPHIFNSCTLIRNGNSDSRSLSICVHKKHTYYIDSDFDFHLPYRFPFLILICISNPTPPLEHKTYQKCWHKMQNW